MMFKSLSIFGKALVGYGINYLLHDNDIKFRLHEGYVLSCIIGIYVMT
jgi:hypothetical protein